MGATGVNETEAALLVGGSEEVAAEGGRGKGHRVGGGGFKAVGSDELVLCALLDPPAAQQAGHGSWGSARALSAPEAGGQPSVSMVVNHGGEEVGGGTEAEEMEAMDGQTW